MFEPRTFITQKAAWKEASRYECSVIFSSEAVRENIIPKALRGLMSYT